MIHRLSRLALIALGLTSPTMALANPKAIVFDCDGVIVESEPLKFKAWQQALKAEHLDLSMEEYLPLVGHDSRAVLAHISELKHRRLKPSLIAKKEKIYSDLQKRGVPLRTATMNFLNYLIAHKAELGIKLGLASGGGKREILENLKQAKITPAFDVILSGHDDLAEFKDPSGTNKPKPYIYQKMSKSLGVDAKDIVVFEDSAAGVEAAAAAGMTVYAIPNDFTKAQDFKHASEVLTLTEAPEPTLARVFTKLPEARPK